MSPINPIQSPVVDKEAGDIDQKTNQNFFGTEISISK